MRRNPVTWNNSATPVTPLYGLRPWTFSIAVVIVCEFVECFASVIMLSIWICERKARIRCSGWCPCGLPALVEMSPRPFFSFFSSLHTHFSWRTSCLFAHVCRTQNRLSSICSSKSRSFKTNSHPKKNKENDSPTTVQTSLPMINTHQAELRCLNCLFFKDVYDAVCQVACPSGEPAGALVRGRFTYYLAPQPAGG